MSTDEKNAGGGTPNTSGEEAAPQFTYFAPPKVSNLQEINQAFADAELKIVKLDARLRATQEYLRSIILKLEAAGLLDASSDSGRSNDEIAALAIKAFLDDPGAKKIGVILNEEAQQAPPTEDVDCLQRHHICHAACCRHAIPMTREEAAEGRFPVDGRRPFFVRHRADGACPFLNGCLCGVYDKRLTICRTYFCRHDKRIWLDFDKMIPGPLIKRVQKQLGG
jgi:hypothetical protein